MSLVIAGAEVRADRWPDALAELTAIQREHPDLLAYDYIRRGWHVGAAVWSRVFGADWPQRPNDRPWGGGFAAEAFEDVYAPDIFGVQLLGPGYGGRAPEHPRWRTEPVGTASVPLKHTELAAWYAAPPIAPPADDSWDPSQPPPSLLTEARSLMAPILYSPGVLSRDGYADKPL